MNLKTMMAVGLASVCLISLGGCANMKAKDTRSLGASTQQDGVDANYVAYVTKSAAVHNVKVYWLNPPVKEHTSGN
ncbi:MAG: hypothetical protein ABI365_01550 [Lysobacteraceae bacterium]